MRQRVTFTWDVCLCQCVDYREIQAVGGQEWGLREQRLSSDAAGQEKKGLGGHSQRFQVE